MSIRIALNCIPCPQTRANNKISHSEGILTHSEGIFTHAGSTFTHAGSIFTYAESIFTCAESIFTCAGSIFTCAGSIFTCAGGLFTCAEGLLTHADSAIDNYPQKSKALLRYYLVLFLINIVDYFSCLAFVFTFCSIFSSTKLSKNHNLHKKNITMPKNLKKRGKPLKIPKVILLTARFLSVLSSKLTTLFAAKLFTTPIKHQIPKRELAMDANSIQERVLIPTINKEVMVYHYGDSDKKILLVHGWSGRGTQLHKIADELLLNGFSTISFDAPAHGKSSGNSTIMIEFIATIMFLETKFGKFEGAIGHSLGGISLLNATKKGLKIDSLITIGSADIIKDIVDDFIFKLQLKPKFSDLLQKHFELKFGATMNSFSGFLSAKEIDIPVLIIHDHDDSEVSVKCAINIHKNLKNGQLMLTKGLGHRQILGNENVIEKVVDFLKQE